MLCSVMIDWDNVGDYWNFPDFCIIIVYFKVLLPIPLFNLFDVYKSFYSGFQVGFIEKLRYFGDTGVEVDECLYYCYDGMVLARASFTY